mmetsp:Transcript_2188/g.2829  ORF Transcript_2188/g.2829 Transcript_2188/m.2829 type:complete len:564 (-) Transcript_2188:109-1800(-)
MEDSEKDPNSDKKRDSGMQSPLLIAPPEDPRTGGVSLQYDHGTDDYTQENPNSNANFPLLVTENGTGRADDHDVAMPLTVDIVTSDQQKPMHTAERQLNKLRNFFSAPDSNEERNSDSNDAEQNAPKIMQYRVTKQIHQKKKGFRGILDFIRTVFSVGKMETSSSTTNAIFINCINWAFRANFGLVFIVCLLFYFLIILFFTALIIAAGQLDKTCINISGDEFGAVNTFTAGFALAWTTFSTVGYGNTSTQSSNSVHELGNCALITIFCSVCSFTGVLYAGFAGAIFFSKVSVIQCRAQVLFSDPIVIRYGKHSNDFADSDDEEESSDDENTKKVPCPVLEFRLVNLMYNQMYGEIVDAKLNCVVSINPEDVESVIQDNVRSDSHHSKKDKTPNITLGKWMKDIHIFQKKIGQVITFNEDPSSPLGKKRAFLPMLIEASDHPFFKRVWVAKHILNETSPLLSAKARKLVKRNNGFWPEHLNNSESVRSCIKFNQIVVSLTGVSNISGSTVYSQKVYDFVNVNVGYQFVTLLYRWNDNTLNVDTSLINDVKEQNGGGGEALNQQ